MSLSQDSFNDLDDQSTITRYINGYLTSEVEYSSSGLVGNEDSLENAIEQ